MASPCDAKGNRPSTPLIVAAGVSETAQVATGVNIIINSACVLLPVPRARLERRTPVSWYRRGYL